MYPKLAQRAHCGKSALLVFIVFRSPLLPPPPRPSLTPPPNPQ